MNGRLAVRVWAGVMAVTLQGGARAGDTAAAQAQLRVASRLAAERSSSAPAAFERAVALDPSGPLADDALLELARFYRPPERPEEGATLDAPRAASASGALTRLLEAQPRGDRAAEARYLRAMIRLAPLPGRDPDGAREDLIEAAGLAAAGPFGARARAALGLLDEEAGLISRAAGSYARVLVEGGPSDARVVASAGLARTLLRGGDFGGAAAVLQRAIDGGGDSASAPLDPSRTLAVRGLLRARSPEGRWTSRTLALSSMPGPKGASLLAAKPDGGFVVYDRKAGSLQAFDVRGNGTGAMALPDATAIAVDPYGRVHAAASDRVVRWDAGGAVPIATLGSLAPARALVVDAAGALIVVDRKGDRLARWTPGSTSWEIVREGKAGSVTALAGDRGRVLATNEKTGGIVAVAAGGAETPVGSAVFRRPLGLAVDPAGQIAVLDVKQETVSLLDPEGRPRDVLSTSAIGIDRPLAIAFAPDGTLLVLDEGSGAVTRVP